MRKNKSLHTRSGAPPKDMNFRAAPVRAAADGPSTFDPDTRSVEVIGATDAPAEVFDWSRMEVVNEVLLMDGLEMSKSRQVPLLDAHSRYSHSSVLGSYRDMKTDAHQLAGRAFFSTVPEAEGPMTKVKEGHMTDFSVGYRVIDTEWVPPGKTKTVKGRSFTGPVSVVTRWRIKELSLVPIGADENATARSGAQKPKKEKAKMNEEFRKLLESLGLSEDADEAAAWAFAKERMLKTPEPPAPPNPPAPPDPKTTDPEKIREEAARAERERADEIDGLCRRFQFPDLAGDLIREGKTVDQARQAILEAVNTREAEKEKHRGFHVSVDIDEREKFRAAAADGLLLRAGISVDKPVPGAQDLMGYSLVEMARMALVQAGQRPHGNVMEMVGRALTTSDLPYLLANVANKSLFEGWNTAPETWTVWCARGRVSDFKTHYSPMLSESSDLDEVPEHAEYKYGKRTEAQESYSVATYGKIFAVSRQAIVNDDLGALTDIPRSHGEAAARKVGDVVYVVLTGNPTMGDSIDLFHASHSNFVASGAGAAPGIATIAAGILAMGTQKDLQGLRRLNIRPQFFISPKALEGTAEVFFRSERFVDSDTVGTDSSLAATRINPYSGSYFTRVYDARLDDALATGWYLAADKGRTVKVFFLNGVESPFLETRDGWTVDGVEYKVRIDVGAKAMDYRGLYFNYGA